MVPNQLSMQQLLNPSLWPRQGMQHLLYGSLKRLGLFGQTNPPQIAVPEPGVLKDNKFVQESSTSLVLIWLLEPGTNPTIPYWCYLITIDFILRYDTWFYWNYNHCFLLIIAYHSTNINRLNCGCTDKWSLSN